MGGLGVIGRWIRTVGIVLGVTACSTSPPAESLRTIAIQQNWQIQPGDAIAGHPVVAGLGDISIQLDGASLYAPFAGEVQPNTAQCVLYSSPELPAYLFRLCGLDHPRTGAITQGEAIGSGHYLHIATLRRQPEGTWTMVEPAQSMLERLLTAP